MCAMAVVLQKSDTRHGLMPGTGTVSLAHVLLSSRSIDNKIENSNRPKEIFQGFAPDGMTLETPL